MLHFHSFPQNYSPQVRDTTILKLSLHPSPNPKDNRNLYHPYRRTNIRTDYGNNRRNNKRRNNNKLRRIEWREGAMQRVSPAVCKSCTLSLSLSLSRASAQPITTACSTPRQFPKFQPAVKSEAGRYVATRIDTFLSSSCMKRAICPAEHDRVCYLDRSLSGPPLKVLGTGGSIDSPIRNERGGRVEREELQPPRARIQRIACAVDASNSIHLYPPPLIDRLSFLPHARADYNTFPTSRDPRRLS